MITKRRNVIGINDDVLSAMNEWPQSTDVIKDDFERQLQVLHNLTCGIRNNLGAERECRRKPEDDKERMKQIPEQGYW